MPGGYVMGREMAKQIEAMFREFYSQYANQTGPRGRWQGNGGGSPCPNRYVFEHLGNPTGGTSTIELYGTYKGVALADDMTAVIDWDATATEIQTALETANGYDPEADPVAGFPVTVSHGPMGFNAVTITLPPGVHLRVTVDSLTPTDAYPYASSCCGV